MTIEIRTRKSKKFALNKKIDFFWLNRLKSESNLCRNLVCEKIFEMFTIGMLYFQTFFNKVFTHRLTCSEKTDFAKARNKNENEKILIFFNLLVIFCHFGLNSKGCLICRTRLWNALLSFCLTVSLSLYLSVLMAFCHSVIMIEIFICFSLPL